MPLARYWACDLALNLLALFKEFVPGFLGCKRGNNCLVRGYSGSEFSYQYLGLKACSRQVPLLQQDGENYVLKSNFSCWSQSIGSETCREARSITECPSPENLAQQTSPKPTWSPDGTFRGFYAFFWQVYGGLSPPPNSHS